MRDLQGHVGQGEELGDAVGEVAIIVAGIDSGAFGQLGIEADDVRQHDADCFTVDDLELRGERIRAGVGGAEHGVLDGDAGVGGTEEHLSTRGDVFGIGHDAGEAVVAEAEGFTGKDGGPGVTLVGHGGFQGVREGIHTGADSDAVRLRDGEFGIEDGDLGGGFHIATGHLDVGFRIGDQGVALALAARAGRGRDGDHRQHGFRRLVRAPVVLHATAVGEDEITPLRRIHAAAAAEADDEVGLELASDGDTAVHILRAGIFPHIAIHPDLDPGLDEKAGGTGDVACAQDARITDDQRPFATEFLGQAAHLGERAIAKDESGAGLMVKGGERHDDRARFVPRGQGKRRPQNRSEVRPRGQSRSGAVDGAALVEELEHIPLMRLIPADLHRADRAEVQSVDGRALQELVGEFRIFRDGGDDQRITDFAQNLGLLHLDHAGIRAEEFTVGQRMLPGVTMNDGRTQEGAALKLDLAGAVAILCGDVFCARLLSKVSINDAVDVIRHLGVGESGQTSVFIIGGERLHRAQALGDGIGDFLAILRHQDGGGIDAGAAAVVADGADDDVDVLLPVFDLVLANDDLAPAWAVHLHTWVAFIHLGHGHIAKDQIATAELHHFTAAFVIGRVETKSLGGSTGCDEGLDQTIRGPRLLTAGFDHHRDLQRDGGEPEGIHRRGVARHHQAEGIGGREKGHRAA